MRRLLARGLYLNLDAVARTINNIILLHTCAKVGHGTGHPPRLRNCVSTSFSRPTRVRSITRAGRGSWLRKRLQHRDLLTRLLPIVNALNNVDTLADRAARRLARGLTRLFGIRLVRPPHERVSTLATPPVPIAPNIERGRPRPRVRTNLNRVKSSFTRPKMLRLPPRARGGVIRRETHLAARTPPENLP